MPIAVHAVTGKFGLSRATSLPLLAGSATLALVVIALGILIAALPAREARTPSASGAKASVSEPLTRKIERPAVRTSPEDAKEPATPRNRQARMPSEEKTSSRPSAEEKLREWKKLSRAEEEVRARPLLDLVVKRHRSTSSHRLRKQIEDVPEVSLYKTLARSDGIAMATAGKAWREVVQARSDLRGLPQRGKAHCRLSSLEAANLQQGAVRLRQHLTAVDGKFSMTLRVHLRADSAYSLWSKTAGVPVLMQMLMAEDEPAREVLIEQLSAMKGSPASVALAQRALYDLDPLLRTKALKALRTRPVDEYRTVLLEGFSYPWAAVADHAAEAVVALNLRETATTLRDLLDRPDPTAPFEKPGQGMYIREVVKINHLRNCLLCHDASTNPRDPVRGQVPPTDEPLGGRAVYYRPSGGFFVRADVTYIKQDFSVPLSVKNPGEWPIIQRFDFVVRARPVDPDNLKEALVALRRRKPADPVQSAHKQALLFALRELTGAEVARK